MLLNEKSFILSGLSKEDLTMLSISLDYYTNNVSTVNQNFDHLLQQMEDILDDVEISENVPEKETPLSKISNIEENIISVRFA